VTRVALSFAAIEDLDRMIVTHSLPASTRARVQRSLRILERFPLVGRQLEGRWKPIRFILGPWRWLLLVYVHDDQQDLVVVLTIQDARSSTSVTNLIQPR
jgi:plasmid stabilization system protein ParE